MLSYFEPPTTINYDVRRDFKVFWKISHSIETIEELFCQDVRTANKKIPLTKLELTKISTNKGNFASCDNARTQ